jgi:hypothetical protein
MAAVARITLPSFHWPLGDFWAPQALALGGRSEWCAQARRCFFLLPVTNRVEHDLIWSGPPSSANPS